MRSQRAGHDLATQQQQTPQKNMGSIYAQQVIEKYTDLTFKINKSMFRFLTKLRLLIKTTMTYILHVKKLSLSLSL